MLGDLAMATPFLRAASEKYRVTVLAKPYAKDLQARFWPGVEVIPFTAPWTTFTHKYRFWTWPWKEILALRRRVSAEKFDFGLSARPRDPRDHLLLKFLGVKHRGGFPHMGSRIFLTHPIPLPDVRAHRYESWRAAAECIGVEMPPRNEPESHSSIASKPILVHTGARLPARVWPLDRYRQIVQRLRRENYTVQVACDPDQALWWQMAGETSVICPPNVTELISLVNRSGLFIGNCSAPGHISAVSGVPTFTIFGPSLPEWFLPMHPEAESIEGEPCPHRPCSDYCRFPVPNCLWNLSQDTVWPKLREFVARHMDPAQKTSPAVKEIALEQIKADGEKKPKAEPRRVLHVHNSADIYGASRSLLRLIRTMDREKFKPLVVLPEEGLLKKLIEAQGVEVVLHPGLSIITRRAFHSWRMLLFFLRFPLSVFFLWRLIRKRKIEFVHTNTGVIVSPALAAKLAGVPHLWHMRDWFQEFRSFWPTFSWYVEAMSDRVVAVSNAVADQFTPREHVTVIHNGFSPEEFDVPREHWRTELRNRFGLNGQFVVGCVGRIKLVRKGQEVLIRATAVLKKRGLNIKSLIVGAPFTGNESHLAQLQSLVRELGVEENVVFTGELADPRVAYSAMDMLAMTSAQPEPFGGVVMEAMSMGLPVVATDIGGSLDQVVDGVTGFFVPPGEPVALADAIEKLMRDPQLHQRMGRAAVKRIEQDFSLKEMTRKIEGIYEEMDPAHGSAPVRN
jgi:glycosyltransferase involved in cell wall biosynthesis/ADP-heptose:LPS heptosyltransferase